MGIIIDCFLLCLLQCASIVGHVYEYCLWLHVYVYGFSFICSFLKEYSEDSNSEPNVDLENQYYNSKALKEDDPKAALSSFQKVEWCSIKMISVTATSYIL